MIDLVSTVTDAVGKIRSSGSGQSRVVMILGSGLGHIAECVEDAHVVRASEIAGYPESTVEGHDGAFVSGSLEGVPVTILSGRIHGYEGHPPEVLGLPARVLCALDPELIVITNAAGGIREDLRPGDLMMLSDHVNLTGRSPLQGPNIDTWGPRFPDMTEVYPRTWRDRLRNAARGIDARLFEGVYGQVPGPQYETPAEINLMRTLGLDAVGMSTVPEAIVASHMGVPALGISVISNQAAGMSGEKLSHAEVLEASATAGRHLGECLLALLRDL